MCNFIYRDGENHRIAFKKALVNEQQTVFKHIKSHKRKQDKPKPDKRIIVE